MESDQRERDNDVNGSTFSEAVIASGQDDQALQVVLDHHQAIAGGHNRHGARMATSRKSANAGMNIRFRVATLHVNTLGQSRKFENLKNDAARMKLDIIGVSDVRWTGVGHVKDEIWNFFYSGGERHYRRVVIFERNEATAAVSKWWPVIDRKIYLQVQGSPINISRIQVYASTTDYEDSEVEEFDLKMDEVRAQGKLNQINIVKGDFNAKICESTWLGVSIWESGMREDVYGKSGTRYGNKSY